MQCRLWTAQSSFLFQGYPLDSQPAEANTAKGDNKNQDSKFPFAGGSGAGVSINPVAFLIVGRNNTIKLIPASFNNPIDRVLDAIPNVIEQIKKSVSGKDQGKSCKKKDNGKED
jgi:uncharacterized spore protein YtfJ